MLFGCCTPLKYYRDIHRLGYDYIELSCRELSSLSDTEYHDFLVLYRDTGLPCLALNDFCAPPHALAGPDYDLSGLQNYLTVLLARASALEVHSIGIGAPASRRLPDQYPAELAETQFCQFLSLASEIAASYHIEILLEPLHTGVCNYINHTEDAISIIHKLHLNNLFLLLDYYHASKMGESPEVLAYAMPFVHHLHISSLSQPGNRDFLHSDDCSFLSEAIGIAKAAGYDRAFSIEPSPSLVTVEKAAESLGMLRKVGGQ